MNPHARRAAAALFTALLAAAAGCGSPWNNPYPAGESGGNVIYQPFSERPKHLDPAQSYSENEVVFTAQIYEPPLQYHYLKRPYELIPDAAERMPEAHYLDARGKPLPANAPAAAIAYTVYEIRIRPGIYYQPHPAFARDAQGRYVYQGLTRNDVRDKHELRDFPLTGTRELKAADYLYEIKRLAHPRLHTPILQLMSGYIVGLDDLARRLRKADAAMKAAGHGDDWLDLTQYPLEGVEVVDDYTYRIKLKGQYPPFLYWLAMPFFAPVPPEVDRFFAQPGMEENNLSLDWYPVGSGPYMLTRNDPNRVMVLDRNPNFHGERYPDSGEPGDAAAGLLADAGKPLPLADRVVFTLEKESIPYWNKFLQGYYDTAGIGSDNFDQAVQLNARGEAEITDAMRKQGIQLATGVSTSTVYLGFNMQDTVVGDGGDEAGRARARKLRQAISIAVDFEEFVSIFRNGRGVPAQGPLPPGIFGYRDGEAGINPVVYTWDAKAGEPRRRPISDAKKLMVEAGYPGGVDSRSGQPLVLHFDVTARNSEDKTMLEWMQRQFAKIDIQLEIRATDYNRFQDKVLTGNAQIFQWGWNADYPDPENFLFLLYGPQGKVASKGENAANYRNPEVDRLFEQMKDMPNSPARQEVIDRIMSILRVDAPWMWGFHPKDYVLYHAWYYNAKPNKIANNTLKYKRVDPALRDQMRREWNRPVLWPLGVAVLMALALGWSAARTWRRHESATGREGA